MQQTVSISELAKSAGVTSRTLRHWERVGLLPRATRTHTGYRMFDAQIAHHIAFIQKAKTVGLTLNEMRRLLELARKGKNPCPEVVKWTDKRAAAVERQIGELKALHKRLSDFRHTCSTSSVLTCFRPGEMCCLIEDLPNPNNGGGHAKAVRARSRAAGNVRG